MGGGSGKWSMICQMPIAFCYFSTKILGIQIVSANCYVTK